MSNFIYQNHTKIYFGTDILGNLGQEVLQYGKKVLLVYGGGSIKNIGLYDKVQAELKKAGVTVFELAGVEPNPRHTTVNKGAKLCKENNIDVVLAVGGGSTIDCSKVIAAANYYDGDAWDLVIGKAKIEKALPLVTILTLSATGSEMDMWAVISNMDKNDKFGVGHPVMYPKASFLNPEYTYSVSAYQTACGSVDIMAHIFDIDYFTLQPKMDMVLRMTEDVLKTVVHYAPVAMENPTDYTARENLMWASTLGLNGFLVDTKGQVAVCHQIEHELSAYYDITHGHGLAIVIPRWLGYCINEQTAPIIQRLGVKVFNLDAKASAIEGAKATVKVLEDFFFKTLKLEGKLSNMGIDDKHFKEISEKLYKNNGTLGSFRPLNAKDIEAILKLCL